MTANEDLDEFARERDELKEELVAAQAVIEWMRSALIYVNNCIGFSSEESATKWFSIVGDVLALQPSTEALAYRDRKRDAALLRECISPNNPMLQAHLEELARIRESGEWEPSL